MIKVMQFIINLVRIIQLRQYGSLWRKITLQYRWHNWQQERNKKKKIRNLANYKYLLKSGVCLMVSDESVTKLLIKLGFIINEDAKIIFTDQIGTISQKESDKLVVFLDLVEQNNLYPLIQQKKIDFVLTPFLNKYNTCQIDKVYYFDSDAYRFYIGRFLLSIDFITFEQFMLHCDELDPFLQTDRVCLSLPEYQTRFNYINQLVDSISLKSLNFAVATGLRHTIGWIGCGLSYKYLFCKALQHNLVNITICEDDVIFEPQFAKKFKLITNYLNKLVGWDVFNGYTFFKNGVDLKHLADFNNEFQLFKTNYLMSMVFNIYNLSTIKDGSKWDVTLRNQENAIDGYLKSCVSSVIVSYPFIVDHNDNLGSVLWCESNEFIYAHMVAESKQVIKDAIKS